MTKGRRLATGAAAVSISRRGIEERKNRITDEYVTGILAFGKKFAFASRPSGKSKNWRGKKMLQKAISLSSFSSVAGAPRRVHY